MIKKISITKFGGTSVADFDCMSRCCHILSSHKPANIVVISAIAKTTRQLLALAALNLSDTKRTEILEKLKKNHLDILERLKDKKEIEETLDQHFNNIVDLSKQLGKIQNKKMVDELLAMGEQMSALLFTQLLKENQLPAIYFDARQVIKTDSNFGKAEPNILAIQKAAHKYLKPLCQKYIVVTQGFIGANDQNETTTLGFESSDYTASLLAAALDAETLQIWTDVPGILSIDPNIEHTANALEKISFEEMTELASFGAKVLHPATLWPVIQKEINVFVGLNRPPHHGTHIVKHVDTSPRLKAITLRKNQVLLSIRNSNLKPNHLFLADVFKLFEQHKINIDIATTSHINIAIVLHEHEITENLLEDLACIGSVTLEDKLTLITLVGNHLKTTSGIGKQLFSLIDQHNIRLITQGASAHNVSFLVSEHIAETLIKTLHQGLLR